MDDKLKIIQDHKWKDFIYGYELTEKEKKNFDYMEKEEIECSMFSRYRKRVYSLSDFMSLHNKIHCPVNPFQQYGDFDGYTSDNYFSGVLIKISKCGGCYKIATYIS